MTSTTFFFVFIPILTIILLAVNFIFAPHNAYQEKNSAFECGFHSFLGQNRTQFSISFFIFALLFLLFDLEILLVYPYVVSAYTNGIYGLVIMLIFFLALTLGFAFELGKNALKIDSRQMVSLDNRNYKSLFSTLSSFKLSGNYLNILLKYLKIISINITLSKFLGALFTIILVVFLRYAISGNIQINNGDYLTNLATGLLGWISNTVSIGWFSEYLGIKGNYNLHQLFFGLQPTGPGKGPGSDGFKPKLYHPMEGDKSIGGSTANSGTSGPSDTSGTSGPPGPSLPFSIILRDLGLLDYQHLENSTKVTEVLTKNGVLNIFGREGKLGDHINPGRLNDTERTFLVYMKTKLEQNWEYLSDSDKLGYTKLCSSIKSEYNSINKERLAELEAARSLLALHKNNK